MMAESDTFPSSSKKIVRFVTLRPMEFVQTANIYKMDRKKRTAVIFNHYKFSIVDNGKFLENRDGTSLDVEQLSIVLKNLHFDVTVYNDLGLVEILQKMIEIRKYDYSDQDCIAVFVLTHGKHNKIAASDYLYYPEEIWNSFNGETCPTLAGKPKLIFINACRGNQCDYGVEFVSDLNLVVDGDHSESCTEKIFKIPSTADTLLVFSTADGYVSNREPNYGTWFIQSFCEHLSNENFKELEFKQILTRISRQVASMVNNVNATQVPVVVSTLIRDLYLN